MGYGCSRRNLAHRPAAADQQSPTAIDAIIDRDGAALVQRGAARHDVLGNRLGNDAARGHGAEQRHDGAAKRRPQIVAVAVGREHDSLRAHGPTSGACLPSTAGPRQGQHPGAAMNRGPGTERNPGKSARKAQWIQIAAATVSKAAA